MKDSVRIRLMKQSDIADVIAIHRRVLPTITTRIGLTYLFSLYKYLFRDPKTHVLLVAYRDSQVVGAITATKNLHKTQKSLQSFLLQPKIVWAVSAAILLRRITIKELVARFVTNREMGKRFPTPYMTVLTFFVDTPQQHHGIGEKLFCALQRQLPRKKLFVDTEIANTAARNWYESHGFHHVDTIDKNIVYSRK